MKLPQYEAQETITSAPGSGRLPLSTVAPRADVGAITEPYHAITQLGAAISDVGNRIDAVAKQREDENDRAEALKLYTGYVKEADTFFSNLKLTADPNAALKTFTNDANQGLTDLQQKYTDQATSSRVKQRSEEHTSELQ